MSECGKKRARKSKLVPRPLVDVDDGEEELHLLKVKKIKPEESINRNTEPDTEGKHENVNKMQKSVPSHYQLEVAICDDDDWEYPEELEPCGEGNSHDDDAVNVKAINNLDEMKIEVEECDITKVKSEISTHSEEDYRIVEQRPVLNEQNDKEDINTVEKCNEAGILRHVLCHRTKIKTRSLQALASEVPIIIGPVSGAKHSVLIEHNYGKNPENADTTQLEDANASNLYFKSKIIQSSPDLLAEFNAYKLETRPAGENHILITNFKTETALLEHGLRNQPPNAKIDESTNESEFKGFWSHKRGIYYAKMFRVMQKFKFNLGLLKNKSCFICKLCCAKWGDDLLEFHNHLYSHRNVLDIKCLGSKDAFYVVADEKPSKRDPGPDTGYTSHSYISNTALANFYGSIDFGIMHEYMRFNDPSIKILCYKCYGCLLSWEHYTDFKHHLNHRTHRREPKFGTEVVNRTKIRVYAYWADFENRPLPLLRNNRMQRLMIFKCLLCKLTLDSQEQLEEHSKTLVECVCGVAGPCDDVAAHKGSCLEHLSCCYPKICMCGGIYETREQLKAHEQTCKENIYASYQCIVCSNFSPTAKTLLEHQKKEHTVRSDEITTVTLLKCKKCKLVHAAPPIWHYCINKQDTVTCKFCEGLFQSTYFLELHQTVFGGAKKCSVKGCFEMLPSGCLQVMHDVEVHAHDVEVHANSKITVIECTMCLSLWLNKEFCLRHIRTSHSFQTQCNKIFPLRKMILKKTMVVSRNGKIEYAQEKPAVPLRTYGNVKPKKKSTKQLNDAQSTPTDTKELPVKNETNNSVDSLQGTKVPEITAETVFMTDTGPKVKEEFTENDTTTVKEEPVDMIENDITRSDVKISYIKLKEYTVTKQSPEDVGEVSANTAEDEEIKKEIDEQNEELSKIFRVSKHLDRQRKLEDEIKTEIKDELLSEDEDELLLFQEYLNESDEDEDISYVPSTSQEPISIDEFIENNSEISCLEPKIVIDEGSRGKIHTCKKCNFRAPFKNYAEHVETCGMAVTPKDEKKDGKFLTAQYKPSYLEQTMTIRCSKCASEFTDMRDYVVHLSKHGPDKVCPCCRQAFSYKHLVQHILATIKRLYVFGYTINASADSLKISKCIQCNTIVANTDYFVHWETRHMASTNKKVDTEVEDRDDVVKNEFSLPREVLQDTLDMLVTEDTHASRVCHVNECKKYFARLHEYKRHLIEHLVPDVLSKKQKYKCLRCQICGDAHDRVEHYKQHMRDHAKLPLYQCQICNKCFSDSSNFAKHKKVHNLKVMVCHNCGRKFQCKKMLERHMRVHIDEVLHKCEKCPVAYSFRSSLKRHVKLMHSAKTARFLCQICRAQFPTVKAKWEHEWEQHKERSSDADCPICFRQFRKFTDVKTHARAEHNIKLRGRRREVTVLLKKLRKFDVPLQEVEQILQWQPLHDGGEKAPPLPNSQDADIEVRVD